MTTAKKKPKTTEQENTDAIDSLRTSPSASRRGGNGTRVLTSELERLYIKSAIAARIIDVIPEEVTRCGFQIQTEDKAFDAQEFRDWWEGLDGDKVLTESLIYSRLYGGGAIMMISRTEGDEAVEWKDSEEIDSLRAIAPAIEMEADEAKGYDDKELGMPLIWNLDPIYGGNKYPVHNSRLLKLPGRPLPVSWRRATNGCEKYFGMSVLQGMVEEIEDHDDCQAWASLLLKRLQQGVWYGDGISDACETVAGKRGVDRRLDLVDTVRSARSTIAVDKTSEDYKLLNGNLSGVKDLLAEKKARLSMVSGIPAVVLAGDTSGGLNNSGDSALSSWTDTIARVQNRLCTPLVQRIIATKYPGMIFNVVWNPLYEETPAQAADRKYKESQADGAYVDKYVLSVEEIRKTLEKRGDYVLSANPPPLPQVQPTEADANPVEDDETDSANQP